MLATVEAAILRDRISASDTQTKSQTPALLSLYSEGGWGGVGFSPINLYSSF